MNDSGLQAVLRWLDLEQQMVGGDSTVSPATVHGTLNITLPALTAQLEGTSIIAMSGTVNVRSGVMGSLHVDDSSSPVIQWLSERSPMEILAFWGILTKFLIDALKSPEDAQRHLIALTVAAPLLIALNAAIKKRGGRP